MSDATPSTGGLSRRSLVKAGTALLVPGVLGALADSATAAVGRSAHVAGRSTIRVGLIGCGGRGTGAAMQALKTGDGVVLYAMGDTFQDRLDSSLAGLTRHFTEHAPQRVADLLQVPPERRFVGFDAYRRVIESDVDVVLLCGYPHFRPLHMEAAVEAGRHVFCEKPMAVDAPGLRRTRAAARAAAEGRLSVVSGFCWRYADAEREIFPRINGGAIGRVVSVYSNYLTSTLARRPRRPEWSDMEFQLRNWWHFTWLSGDHIVEQACHSIDRMSWAMNDTLPIRCHGVGGRAARSGPESGNSFDHFSVVYEYDDGRRAFHVCRQIDNCPGDNSDYIQGENGAALVNGFSRTHQIRDRGNAVVWKYEGQHRDMYQNEQDVLFEAIRSGTPRNDGEWMCNSTMLAIMGRMACYTGQTISWEQAWASEEDLSPPAHEFGDLPEPIIAVPGRTRFR